MRLRNLLFGVISSILLLSAPAWSAPGLSAEFAQAIGKDIQAVRLHISRDINVTWQPVDWLVIRPLWEITVGHIAPKGELSRFDDTWQIGASGILFVPLTRSERFFGEFSIGAVLVSEQVVGPEEDTTDLGNQFLFRTHVGVGAYLDSDKRLHIMYRLQHISNGGLGNTNPGLDSHGFLLGYRF